MHRPIYAAKHHGPVGAGQSAAQLIYDEEHEPWIVKSVASVQGGVNGAYTLFNDYVATRLAEELGLPVGRVASIAIDNEFLTAFPDLLLPTHGSFTRGFHFAIKKMQGLSLYEFYSLYANALRNRPDLFSGRIVNKTESNAIIAFDSWTFNADRAANLPGGFAENAGNLFLESIGPKQMRMVMIDQGLAFGGSWHNDPLRNDTSKLGNWPIVMLGYMNFFFQNGMVDLGECQRWATVFSGVTLKTLSDIVDEVPTAWRRNIDDATASALATTLLTRALTLHSTFIAQYPLVYAGAKARGVAV